MVYSNRYNSITVCLYSLLVDFVYNCQKNSSCSK